MNYTVLYKIMARKEGGYIAPVILRGLLLTYSFLNKNSHYLCFNEIKVHLLNIKVYIMCNIEKSLVKLCNTFQVNLPDIYVYTMSNNKP